MRGTPETRSSRFTDSDIFITMTVSLSRADCRLQAHPLIGRYHLFDALVNAHSYGMPEQRYFVRTAEQKGAVAAVLRSPRQRSARTDVAYA